MAKKSANALRSNEIPDPILLSLVAQFLQKNGFKSAYRIYNNERQKRPRMGPKENSLAKDYVAQIPSLETIFRAWKHDNETGDAVASYSKSSAGKDSSEASSSDSLAEKESSSDSTENSSLGSSSDSDDDSLIEPNAKGTVGSTLNTVKPLKRKAPDSVSVSSDQSDSDNSSSESDSNGESKSFSEDRNKNVKHTRPAKKPRFQPITMSSDNKSSSDADSKFGSGSESESELSSDSDSNSDSGRESESDSSRASASLQKTKDTKIRSSSEEDSSSDDDSSSFKSSSANNEVSATVAIPGSEKASSESSGTVMGDAEMVLLDSVPSSGGNIVKLVGVATTAKKRHVGAQPTRLAEMSATADPHDFISNQYISYDYADKAYRDLSITRGKGFTKEKNKKKRGSYRGGAIDISGGKAFKFDD